MKQNFVDEEVYNYINNFEQFQLNIGQEYSNEIFHIYITENLINGKKYIGQHKGTYEDNYLGSSKILQQSIAKYGRENFRRTILEETSTQCELDEKEIAWIEKFDAVNRNDFYNLTSGGTGGNTLEKLTESELECRSNKIKSWFKNLSEEEKENLSKIRSVNQKKQRQDKLKEQNRIASFRSTMENKSKEWKAERYSNQKNSNHYCARKVKTPDGIFNLASDAAKNYNICVQTVLNRCKNEKFKDWKFLDERPN